MTAPAAGVNWDMVQMILTLLPVVNPARASGYLIRMAGRGLPSSNSGPLHKRVPDTIIIGNRIAKCGALASASASVLVRISPAKRQGACLKQEEDASRQISKEIYRIKVRVCEAYELRRYENRVLKR